MATTPPFHYQPMFEHGEDKTEYYLLTKDYVSVSEFEGKPMLKIEKEGLTAMANTASAMCHSCCAVRTMSKLLRFCAIRKQVIMINM